MATYLIHEGNYEAFKQKIAKLERKFNRLHCPIVVNEVENVFKTDDDGNTNRFIKFEVEGKAIINDWELVAAIDHINNGVIIRKVDQTAEIPDKYKRSDYNFCEHCNSHRARKVVYVLRNKLTGEWKQVGASCVKDFTRGYDAEWAARYFEYLEDLESYDGAFVGGWSTPYHPVKEYLCFAIECINKFGWFNSSSEYPTKVRAANYMIHPDKLNRQEMKSAGFDATRSSVVQEAEDAIAYLMSLEDDGDYVTSLKTILSEEYTTSKYFGYVASLGIFYKRHIDAVKAEDLRKKEHELKKEKSKFVGEAGERIERKLASFRYVTSVDSMYGYSHLYELVDIDCNVYTWWTSSAVDESTCVAGKTFKGTVKKHEEYKGVNQTCLTRVKIA